MNTNDYDAQMLQEQLLIAKDEYEQLTINMNNGRNYAFELDKMNQDYSDEVDKMRELIGEDDNKLLEILEQKENLLKQMQYENAEFIDKIDYDYKIKCEQYEEKIEALNSEILRNGV